MNNKYRNNLREKVTKKLPDGSIERVVGFPDLGREQTVGASMFYTGHAVCDMSLLDLKKGDKIYFKANSTRGINPNLSRTEESYGSCEDLAEVGTYHAIVCMNEQLGDDAVLDATGYVFAEVTDDALWAKIKKDTHGLVESSRVYGCASKDCVGANATIIHGNEILRCVIPPDKSLVSSVNTVYNYAMAEQAYVAQAAKNGQHVVVHPKNTRADVNLLFLDYFNANSDRHCKNITKKVVKLADGSQMLVNTSVLDNGGGMAMQSRNCKNLYAEQLEIINKNGRLSPYEKTVTESGKEFVVASPFNASYDFTIGAEIFKDASIAAVYNDLAYEEQLVMLISQNKTLFNDFKNMYVHLDFDEGYARMSKAAHVPYMSAADVARRIEQGREVNHANDSFLPGMNLVIPAVKQMKKEMVSRAMAKAIGVEFDQKAFDADDLSYVNMFEGHVKEDELTVHIASNQEIKDFENNLKAQKVAQKQ